MDGKVHGNRPHSFPAPVDVLITASLAASCSFIFWIILQH